MSACFLSLKHKLSSPPMLGYPNFNADAKPFVLQTDARATSLGAVLEQDKHVIGHTLSFSENIIPKECLAQCMELSNSATTCLDGPFELVTDHAPLQWLLNQKMEGMLCRWALALQEYLTYCKGSHNGNTDALSCLDVNPAAISLAQTTNAKKEIWQNDPVIKSVYDALKSEETAVTTKLAPDFIEKVLPNITQPYYAENLHVVSDQSYYVRALLTTIPTGRWKYLYHVITTVTFRTTSQSGLMLYHKLLP